MSYLLEALGRGLVGRLVTAFEPHIPNYREDDPVELRRRLSACPTSADLAVRLGGILLRNMRLREAKELFEAALRSAASPRLPWLGLACVYDDLGDVSCALEHLARARRVDPKDPAIAYAAGFCHERLGDVEAAAREYERAVTLKPQARHSHERLAAIAISQQDWGRAAVCYGRLAELDPADLPTRMTLAALHLERGECEGAIREFQQALLFEPEGGDDPFEAMGDLNEDAPLSDAIEALEQVVERFPSVSVFHVHLADLYVRNGDDDAAIAEYEQALVVQPDFLEATVKLGAQHLRRGRLLEAAGIFRRATDLNDRLMTAFIGLGVAQDLSGLTEDASATFDLAASLEPSTTLLYAETAQLQLRADRLLEARVREEPPDEGDEDHSALLGEALKRHERALAGRRNDAELQYRCGLLLRQLGHADRAQQAFLNAATIAPSFSQAQAKLAISLRESGRRDEAHHRFTRVVRPEADQLERHYRLGLLFAQHSRFDTALNEFSAQSDEDAAVRENLSLSLKTIGIHEHNAFRRTLSELPMVESAVLSWREKALRGTRR